MGEVIRPRTKSEGSNAKRDSQSSGPNGGFHEETLHANKVLSEARAKKKDI